MRRARLQCGVALVTALLIVALVAAIAAALSLGQQIWLQQVQNLSDRAQAESVRRGALDSVCQFLDQDAKNSQTDNLNEDWAESTPPWEAEGGTATIKIEDALGRFNLNSVINADGIMVQANLEIFQQLLNLLGLDTTLGIKLVDWVDSNNTTEADGADDTDYLALPKPHRAANQKLATVDELRLVMGFDEDAVEKLRPYVVALPSTDTKININTAPDYVLASFFRNMTLDNAQQIVQIRQKKPFADNNQITPYLDPGVFAPNANYDVKTTYFIVTVDVSFGRLQRKYESIVRRLGNNDPCQILWHYPVYPKLPKYEDDN